MHMDHGLDLNLETAAQKNKENYNCGIFPSTPFFFSSDRSTNSIKKPLPARVSRNEDGLLFDRKP